MSIFMFFPSLINLRAICYAGGKFFDKAAPRDGVP